MIAIACSEIQDQRRGYHSSAYSVLKGPYICLRWKVRGDRDPKLVVGILQFPCYIPAIRKFHTRIWSVDKEDHLGALWIRGRLTAVARSSGSEKLRRLFTYHGHHLPSSHEYTYWLQRWKYK